MSSDPEKCTLWLCEGASARKFIEAMLEGNNIYFGILELKGKPLNLRII